MCPPPIFSYFTCTLSYLKYDTTRCHMHENGHVVFSAAIVVILFQIFYCFQALVLRRNSLCIKQIEWIISFISMDHAFPYIDTQVSEIVYKHWWTCFHGSLSQTKSTTMWERHSVLVRLSSFPQALALQQIPPLSSHQPLSEFSWKTPLPTSKHNVRERLLWL